MRMTWTIGTSKPRTCFFHRRIASAWVILVSPLVLSTRSSSKVICWRHSADHHLTPPLNFSTTTPILVRQSTSGLSESSSSLWSPPLCRFRYSTISFAYTSSTSFVFVFPKFPCVVVGQGGLSLGFCSNWIFFFPSRKLWFICKVSRRHFVTLLAYAWSCNRLCFYIWNRARQSTD